MQVFVYLSLLRLEEAVLFISLASCVKQIYCIMPANFCLGCNMFCSSRNVTEITRIRRWKLDPKSRVIIDDGNQCQTSKTEMHRLQE